MLPRENADGVPVTTVNITKLRLKIIRVGDRLLSQIESGTVDETTLYAWKDTDLESSQGALVWQGTMDVANVKNDSVVTLVPIHDILKGKPPGAYVLVAMDAAQDETKDYYEEGTVATQWVVDSDIALTSFQGTSGLTVFARSYATAHPIGGVKLTLVAKDNNVLTTVTTDGDGRADFPAGLLRATGGDTPVVVMAYGAGGFQLPRPSALRLRSDRSRRQRPRGAGPDRRVPLYRAGRLSPRRDGAIDDHAARPRRRGDQFGADPDRDAARRA